MLRLEGNVSPHSERIPVKVHKISTVVVVNKKKKNKNKVEKFENNVIAHPIRQLFRSSFITLKNRIVNVNSKNFYY